MVKAFFVALLLQLPQVSGDYPIKKIWLFTQTVYAGNVPRRVNGKQLSGCTEKVLCFIEIDKDQAMPDWQVAYFKGNKYSVNAVQLTQEPVRAWTEKNTGTPVTIKAGGGNKLIQLMLTLKQAGTDIKAGGFMVDGTLNNKAVHLKSGAPAIELSPEMMP